MQRSFSFCRCHAASLLSAHYFGLSFEETEEWMNMRRERKKRQFCFGKLFSPLMNSDLLNVYLSLFLGWAAFSVKNKSIYLWIRKRKFLKKFVLSKLLNKLCCRVPIENIFICRLNDFISPFCSSSHLLPISLNFFFPVLSESGEQMGDMAMTERKH